MMAYNLFIAVVLSTCLHLTAQARTPQVALRPLPTELTSFYQSLHQVLGKQTVWNKAQREGIDLKSLQAFLSGQTLASEARSELWTFREEYAALLNDKVDVADLLKYNERQELVEGIAREDSEWQELAEDISKDTADEYIELVDDAIRNLPAKNKLYLFIIKLELADGTEVTLIKPGQSKPSNIAKRVREQISLLSKIEKDLEEVKFSIDGHRLAVEKMTVEQVNLGDGRQKYSDLNYGVTDTDVHRQLVADGYQMVRGIPNKVGGEKKEVFVKLDSKESNYVDDVKQALATVQAKTYFARRDNKNGINGNGISLFLPSITTAELVFAEIKFSAAGFETKQAELAKMLLEIKWYEHRTGNEDDVIIRELYTKFDQKLEKSTAEIKEEIERLSDEVFLVRRIISAIQAVEGGGTAFVGIRLGLGSVYGYASHLKDGLGTTKLVAMGMAIKAEYSDHLALFDKLLELRGETEVNTAMQLLHESIEKAGGWQALQNAWQTSTPRAASKFRNALADAALWEKPPEVERIAEVVLLYSIISAIQKKGETVGAVGRKLGLGRDYSYASHLKDGLDTTKLVAMGSIIDNKYPHHKALFNKLLELRGETEEVKVNAAMQLLHESIDLAGSWQVLQNAWQTDTPGSSAGQFRKNLVTAALWEKQPEAERIAEVVLLYRIISAIQKEGEEVAAVGRRLGLAKDYSYASYLEKGLNTTELVAMGSIIDNKYPHHKALFNKLLELRGETEEVKVNAAMQLLRESIDLAGGWQALQSALETLKTGTAGDATAASHFRNVLAAAAVREETAERMAEVVLLYRIISAIQAVEGGGVPAVGSKLGLGGRYSYASHLKEGLDTTELVVMGMAIKAEYSAHRALFNELLELRGETEEVKVNAAMELLHESIDLAGGWQALQNAWQTGAPNAASKFRKNLVTAALWEKAPEAERIAEVVLLYRIISAIQAVEGGIVSAVGGKLGLGTGRDHYSYARHLKEGLAFDLQKLQTKIEAIKETHKENTKLHKVRKNIDDSIKLLKNLREKPKQLELPLAG